MIKAIINSHQILLWSMKSLGVKSKSSNRYKRTSSATSTKIWKNHQLWSLRLTVVFRFTQDTTLLFQATTIIRWELTIAVQNFLIIPVRTTRITLTQLTDKLNSRIQAFRTTTLNNSMLEDETTWTRMATTRITSITEPISLSTGTSIDTWWIQSINLAKQWRHFKCTSTQEFLGEEVRIRSITWMLNFNRCKPILLKITITKFSNPSSKVSRHSRTSTRPQINRWCKTRVSFCHTWTSSRCRSVPSSYKISWLLHRSNQKILSKLWCHLLKYLSRRCKINNNFRILNCWSSQIKYNNILIYR